MYADKYLRWQKEQQYQAEKKLKANGLLVQRKLEIEIELLAEEEATLSEEV